MLLRCLRRSREALHVGKALGRTAHVGLTPSGKPGCSPMANPSLMSGAKPDTGPSPWYQRIPGRLSM